MNDLTLQKARAYEAEHGAAISPAERPAYHMTPYVGWLNDPNGFSYYKGKYHQFYQYNPYDVRWAPMHWGHAVSTDLLHWEYLPCALAPDSPADNGPGRFSGSATEMDDGKQLLMYTSVVAEKQPNGEMRDIQTQSIAIGDGLNYEKPACNPVLTQKDLPEGFSKFDFRDPKIWREADGTYSAVTVCRVVIVWFVFLFASRRRHAIMVSDGSSGGCASDLPSPSAWPRTAAAQQHCSRARTASTGTLSRCWNAATISTAKCGSARTSSRWTASRS